MHNHKWNAQHSRVALFTDLYELTMVRAYFELGMSDQAVFSLFVRKLPVRRNYLVACGLESLIGAIEQFRFSADDLDYLGSLGIFPDRFLKWLEAFRFTGNVFAMPEGTPAFANEPLLEVVAPIAEGQLIETLVLNQIGVQTLLASKASRIVEAARGRRVVDFGARRAQGLDAALQGARAFYIAGVAATSNVLAGRTYGIPLAGTVAHSFIEACKSEAEAFAAFSGVFPATTLLVDTYDTLAGVRRVVALAKELGTKFQVKAVRLDSGDLLQLSRGTRRILDHAGLRQVQIFASGGLDEAEIDRLLQSDAPIDAFGVGTDMSVSGDAPALDIAYKLTEYAGRGRMKLSTGKRTLPGRKQVFRELRDGLLFQDVIARHDETWPGSPLLDCVMAGGLRLPGRLPPLSVIAAHTRDNIAHLPPAVRALPPAEPPYTPLVSPALEQDERATWDSIAAIEELGSRAASRGPED